MKNRYQGEHSKMLRTETSTKIKTVEQSGTIPEVLFIEAQEIANPSMINALFSSFQTFLKNQELVIKVHIGQKDLVRAIEPLIMSIRNRGKYPSRIFITDDGMSLSTQMGSQNIKALGEYFTHSFSTDNNPQFLLPPNSSLLNFAHTTGHAFTGYSSAISNIGFGIIDFIQREKLHRASGNLEINPFKCDGCADLSVRLCVINCYRKAIQVTKAENNKLNISINTDKCNYCTHCLICPKGVFNFSVGYIDKFLELLVQSARHICEKFQGSLHINYAMNITPFCDCMQCLKEENLINIGLLMSEDIVALEKATIDMIAQKSYGNSLVDFENASKLIDIAEQASLGRAKYTLVEL